MGLNFLKPEKYKTALFAALLVASFFLVFNNTIRDGGCDTQGFPLPIIKFNCISFFGSSLITVFSITNLILDSVFWYLASCLIWFLVGKITGIKKFAVQK